MTDRGSPPDPSTIVAVFDLGPPTSPLRPVPGGYSHRMWRLTTECGSYTVKELNRDFDDLGYLDRYEAAFRVELVAFASGIELPRPVQHPATGAGCAELPGTGPRPTTVRVHEWVEGEPLRLSPVKPEVASSIGRLLARIHAMELPSDATPADVLFVHGPEHWHALCERTVAAGLMWSTRVAELQPLIGQLESLVLDERPRPARLIVTHRDLAPGNLILPRSGEPVAVDWDSSGPWIPAYEVASAALAWAGVPMGEPDEASARALVRGYVSENGCPPESTAATLAGWVCQTLGWLDICVRRSLGERVHSAEHQRAASTEATRVLDTLPTILPSLDRWAGWLRR